MNDRNDRNDRGDRNQATQTTDDDRRIIGATDSDSLDARDVRDDRDTRRTGVVSDTTDTSDEGFLPEQEMTGMRDQWSDIQASFIDDPKNAVQQAHDLVTKLVNDLTDVFARERSTLEGQWAGGGNADTETLRVALQRYRSFFNRLLGTTDSN